MDEANKEILENQLNKIKLERKRTLEMTKSKGNQCTHLQIG